MPRLSAAERFQAARTAAETGDVPAMSRLSAMYANGVGVPRDDTAALETPTFAIASASPRSPARLSHQRAVTTSAA
jgi:TPR repeat protein